MLRLGVYSGAASADGKFYPRYPAGDAPNRFWPLAGSETTSATGQFRIPAALSANPSEQTAASGSLSAPTITNTLTQSAVVGTPFTLGLTGIGGSGTYGYHRVSCYPNSGGAFQCDGAQIIGTPQMNETETMVIQITDLVTGQWTQATFTIVVTVTGSLAILTTAAGIARDHSIGARKYIGEGGRPPYKWSQATVTQPWWVTPDGWEMGTPTSTGTVDLSVVTLTDSSGATATFHPTVVVSSGMSFGGVDSDTGYLTVPFAFKGSKFRHAPTVYGAASTPTLTVISGSLHSGLSLISGAITGTPTQSGARLVTIQAIDGVNTPITAQILLTCLNTSQVSRPSYNTGTSSFVDANGILRDPGGNERPLHGVDRNHYDSPDWSSGANGALSGANAVRQFFGFGQFWQTAAAICTQISNEYLANKIFPIVTVAGVQTDFTATCSGTTLTVSAVDTAVTTANCGLIVLGMALSATGITGTAPKVLSGPSNGVAGVYTLDRAYTFGSQTVVGTLALTSCSDPNGVVGATNMLIYALGAGMLAALTDGAINIANEWSASSHSSWQSTYIAAIAALRTAGFLGPILIDAPGGGQDWTAIISNGAAVLASDSQRNVFFSFHIYGGTDNATASITNIVSSGTSTIVSIDSMLAHSQFDFFNIFPSNTFNGISGYVLSGVQGMTGINGLQPSSNNNLGGTANNWTVTLSVDSRSMPAYTGGGTIVTRNNYGYALEQLAALRDSSGICTIVGEFGPGQNVGLSPTLVTVCEVVTACVARGIPRLYWAWDDNYNGTGGDQAQWTGSGGFDVTGPVNTSYVSGDYVTSDPGCLTANGMDVIGNPRYGICALAAPAPATL